MKQSLTDAERKVLYANVKNSDITNILQILLNISEAFFQAEINGRKPDFSRDHTRPVIDAQNDIECLIKSLLR